MFPSIDHVAFCHFLEESFSSLQHIRFDGHLINRTSSDTGHMFEG